MATNKLTPLEALLQMQAEQQDVQKALAPSLYQVGKKMKKKGKKAAWGSKFGEYALPWLADLGIKTALNLIAPGMGNIYAAAKKVPALKAAGKGTLAAYGSKLGGEFAAGQVSVPDAEELMQKYLGETASGTKAMRFGRGAVESIEGQKGLQLEALQESIGTGATKAGFRTAGQSLLGDLSKARKGRLLKEGGGAVAGGEAVAGGGPYDILSDIRKGKGDLSVEDYLTAIQESGGEDIKSLFDISPIREELGRQSLAKNPLAEIKDTSFMFEDLYKSEKLALPSHEEFIPEGFEYSADSLARGPSGGWPSDGKFLSRKPTISDTSSQYGSLLSGDYGQYRPVRPDLQVDLGKRGADVTMEGFAGGLQGIGLEPKPEYSEMAYKNLFGMEQPPVDTGAGFDYRSAIQQRGGAGEFQYDPSGLGTSGVKRPMAQAFQEQRVGSADKWRAIKGQRMEGLGGESFLGGGLSGLRGYSPGGLGMAGEPSIPGMLQRQPLGYDKLMNTLQDIGMSRRRETSGFRQQPFDFLNYLNQPGQGQFGTGFYGGY